MKAGGSLELTAAAPHGTTVVDAFICLFSAVAVRVHSHRRAACPSSSPSRPFPLILVPRPSLAHPLRDSTHSKLTTPQQNAVRAGTQGDSRRSGFSPCINTCFQKSGTQWPIGVPRLLRTGWRCVGEDVVVPSLALPTVLIPLRCTRR